MEPYYPSIEPRMRGVLGPHGYEIVRFNHMRGKSPASYSILTARDMIEAIKSIDGPTSRRSCSSAPTCRWRARRRGRALARQAGDQRQRRHLLARLPHERHRRQALRLHAAVLAVLAASWAATEVPGDADAADGILELVGGAAGGGKIEAPSEHSVVQDLAADREARAELVLEAGADGDARS
jgi:hypothetical protein